jgi:hypothetical protein
VARTINIRFKGKESVFSISKLSRAKLYGRKRRIPLGPDGKPCERASLAVNEGILLQKGMTGQGYLDSSGNWLERGTLIGVDSEGKPIEAAKSTLGEFVDAEEISVEEVLDLRVSAVYAINPKDMDAKLKKELLAGKRMGFDFNYREDYQMERAVLVANDEGFFALVGQPTKPQWSECDGAPVSMDEGALEEDEGELDFEMF